MGSFFLKIFINLSLSTASFFEKLQFDKNIKIIIYLIALFTEI